MRRVLGVTAVALLTACQSVGMRQTVAQSAIEYNVGYEQAGNRLLLLNIVRAMHHQPKYFTALTTMAATRPTEGGVGPLSIPFGGAATSAFSVAVSGKQSVTPAANFTVLDSKVFTQGLLSPVSGGIIKQLLDQGWPPEFLWLLLVERIQVDGTAYVNDPEDPADFSAFQAMLRDKMLAQTFGVIRQDDVPIGPPVARDDAAKVAAQVAYAKDGLALRCVTTQTLTTPPPYHACPGHLSLVRTSTQYGWSDDRDKSGRSSIKIAALERVGVDGLEALMPRDPSTPVPTIIRSPDGVISYLGAVVRAQRQSGEFITYRGREDGQQRDLKLFDLEAMGEAEPRENPGEVHVLHNGTRFRINPSVQGNRSLQSLALVNLLLGLQKEASELKTPGVFTIIGG